MDEAVRASRLRERADAMLAEARLTRFPGSEIADGWRFRVSPDMVPDWPPIYVTLAAMGDVQSRLFGYPLTVGLGLPARSVLLEPR